MGNVHMEATQINYRGGSKKMSVADELDSLKSGLTNVTTALGGAKVYKNDWANNLTIPLGMCTIVMFALTTGANDMYIYNSASNVLSPIRGSGMTAVKNQDDTVTLYSNAGSGRFVALILA